MPYLDVCAAIAPDEQTLTIGVINRHPDTSIEAELRLVGARAAATCVAETVGGPDVHARNSFEQPDLVGVASSTWAADAVRPTYTFPPHAVAMLTIPLR